jgi:hypothetical protein
VKPVTHQVRDGAYVVIARSCRGHVPETWEKIHPQAKDTIVELVDREVLFNLFRQTREQKL